MAQQIKAKMIRSMVKSLGGGKMSEGPQQNIVSSPFCISFLL